jgi:hypothetical protein
VVVGDTLTLNFCIANPDVPYSPPGPPVTVTVGPSTCPSFGWTTGEWTLVEGPAYEQLWMSFHPSEAGDLGCILVAENCEQVILQGLGVLATDDVPPIEGGTGVENKGTYDAMVSLVFDYRSGFGVPWERDSLQVAIPPSEYKELRLPRNFRVNNENLIRNVEIRAEAATGVPADPWATIFRTTFPGPVMKCYLIGGTLPAPTWSEFPGCELHTHCPCN